MASPFYSSEQTDLSRAVLGEIVAAVPEAVLIGGWASWVRTGGAMSHDIDLIVSHVELGQLGAMVDDLSDNAASWFADARSDTSVDEDAGCAGGGDYSGQGVRGRR